MIHKVRVLGLLKLSLFKMPFENTKLNFLTFWDTYLVNTLDFDDWDIQVQSEILQTRSVKSIFKGIFQAFNTLNMAVGKYICFVQTYVYHCKITIVPKKLQIPSRIFSRINSKVLYAQKICWEQKMTSLTNVELSRRLCCKLCRVSLALAKRRALCSAVYLASKWYLRLNILWW